MIATLKTLFFPSPLTPRPLPLALALALSLAACWLACPLAEAQAAGPAVATKLAVVNPAKIFNELQETQDLKKAMESKHVTLQSQENDKRSKLRDLQNARDSLKPDAPQYADRNKELMQAGVEFEVWGKMMQADLQREQKMQMKSLFDKIIQAVKEVADAKGLDIVISKGPEFPESIENLSIDETRLLINSRIVLFANSSVDISSDVIATMDAKYKGGH